MNDMQIRCFLEAARCLNFTEAAARLYISQSVLSRHIAALEGELNMQLFIRYKRTVRLTPAGSVLANGLRQFREEFDICLEEAQAVNQGVSAILNVGCLEEQLWGIRFADVLQRFGQEHPGVRVNLSRHSYRGLREGLYDGSIDLAIGFAMDLEGREGLICQTVESLDTYLVIPADHPKAEQAGLTLADFRDETFLTVAAEESELVADLLPNSCREAGFSPRLLVAPNFSTLTLWLEAGFGIYGLNEQHVLYHNPRLKFLLIPDFQPRDMVLAWRRDNNSQAVRLFREETARSFRKRESHESDSGMD